MSRFWSPLVHSLTPYVPGEQPSVANLVKLNTNENPYGPSPKVREALRGAVGDGLRLYPDPDSKRLKRSIASFYGADPAEIFVGNGSDEVLAFVFPALLHHPLPLLFPDVTYSFYPVYCGLYGIEYHTVPLTDRYEVRLDDYARPNGGILFANPNAPTGRALPRSSIEALLRRNTESVVVVDEAYVDFGADTVVPLVKEYPNLLVVQTLSKSRSLAGLRVGFAVGHPSLIEGLERVKNCFNSYPIDRLAEAGAVAALDDRAFFDDTRQAVIATRELLTADLEGLGFEVLPSAANFVFARHPSWDAAVLAAELRARGVLVRHFAKPRIDQFLRITVGTDGQRNTLRRALEAILGVSRPCDCFPAPEGAALAVRPFRPSDEDEVVGLWEACGLVVPWNNPRRDVLRKLAAQPELFLVGTLANRVVGSVMAGYEGHRGWLNYLAVAPDCRRKGLGRRLVEEAEVRLAALGCPKINLQVRAPNTGALAFYQTLGFASDDVVSLGKRLVDDR